MVPIFRNEVIGAVGGDMMKVLFDFDNRAGMPGTTLSVSFGDGVITETLSDTAAGIDTALRVTSFGNGAAIVDAYDYDGSVDAQHTTIVVTSANREYSVSCYFQKEADYATSKC
jgi:hypothetical protein